MRVISLLLLSLCVCAAIWPGNAVLECYECIGEKCDVVDVKVVSCTLEDYPLTSTTAGSTESTPTETTTSDGSPTPTSTPVDSTSSSLEPLPTSTKSDSSTTNQNTDSTTSGTVTNTPDSTTDSTDSTTESSESTPTEGRTESSDSTTELTTLLTSEESTGSSVESTTTENSTGSSDTSSEAEVSTGSSESTTGASESSSSSEESTPTESSTEPADSNSKSTESGPSDHIAEDTNFQSRAAVTAGVRSGRVRRSLAAQAADHLLRTYRSYELYGRDIQYKMAACYSIVVDGVINRGCVRIPEGQSGCDAVRNQVGQPDKSDDMCDVCVLDRCNGSATLKLSLASLLLLLGLGLKNLF
ncbi:cell wall protein DAN4 isoform X5 [Drosophila innubila]|uniref:cell wall protein DAN4 isoform X5 n=1 Tax=Drosophila innubila TaxID=198719 RepID=UPI00148B9D3F|nr:cell wall protein DAN4 isoform X5 [Drosophila innubila]